jgi:hypothetical protein
MKTFLSKIRIHLLPLLALMLLAFPALTACGSSSNGQALEMAPLSEMPDAVQQAPLTVQEAYQFAVANPEALKNVGCYCGCGPAGHTSNYSCYVREEASAGEIVFDKIVYDQHALGCSICVDITQDVMKMTAAGKTPAEIRQSIDQTYSQYGPSNLVSAP